MGFHGVKVKSILQLCKYFSFFLLCTSPWPSCREVEGGGWIAIADSHTVAVVSVPASLWYGSPSMAADAAWGLRVGFSWLDGVAWMLPAHSGEGRRWMDHHR